jgi:hypothetical protein
MGIYLGVAIAQLIGGYVVGLVGETLWRMPLVGESGHGRWSSWSACRAW